MKVILFSLKNEDRREVMDIFNYYIENSFAAYPDQALPDDFFDMLLMMCSGYPTTVARNDQGTVMGFGFLRPYNPIPAFLTTAEITYFVRPGFTGKGVGKAMLDYLLAMGKRQGLNAVLANVSSLNEDSIRFHTRNGFSQCARIKSAGRKMGRTFDVLYFQRLLQEET